MITFKAEKANNKANNNGNHIELREIIEKLVSMDGDIFNITKNDVPTDNRGCSITLNIYFNDFSAIKRNSETYTSKLEKIIELLKDIKEIKKKMNSLPNHYKLDILLYEPQEQFSEEYNQFIVDFNSKLGKNNS